MKTHVSITGLSAAIMLFATAAAMHEAVSADRLTAPGVTPGDREARRQARKETSRFQKLWRNVSHRTLHPRHERYYGL